MYTTNISIKAFLGWGLSPRVCSLDCCKAPPASIITQFVKQAMCWCGGVGAPRANNEPTGSLVCKQVRKEEWQGNNSVSLTGEGLTSWRGGKWFVPADWHRLQKKNPLVQLQDWDLKTYGLALRPNHWFSSLSLQNSPGGNVWKCGYLGLVLRDSNLGDVSGPSTLLLRNTIHSK